MFCFFQASFKSSKYADDNSPFSRFTIRHHEVSGSATPDVRRSYPDQRAILWLAYTHLSTCKVCDLQMSIDNLELVPNRIPIELSRIAFPTIVLPKADRTDFAQEERLGLPCWTMILATFVSVNVSKISGHSDFWLFNNDAASSILIWVWAGAASAACPLHLGSLAKTSITFCSCHLWRRWTLLCEYCKRARIIFYYVTSNYNSALTDVHQRRMVHGFAFFPWHFLELVPFFVHSCFSIWYFHCLRHRKNLCTRL